MEKKEINEIFEVLDILKLFAIKGKEELKEFAIYMISFGFWTGINTFLSLFTKYSLWFITLPIAFFISHINVAGFLISLIVWGVIFLFNLFLVHFISIKFPLLFLFLYISSFVIGVNFIYRYRFYKKKEKGFIHSYPIISTIGIFWGIIFAGAIIFFLASEKIFGIENIDYLSILFFSYALSVAFLISGLIAPFFYFLSIISFIVIPITLIKSVYLAALLYGVLGILMGIYGVYLWKK
ncbi:MAG: hypothetical protein ABIM49_04460 [candidate division WOR-3 bacterium]